MGHKKQPRPESEPLHSDQQQVTQPTPSSLRRSAGDIYSTAEQRNPRTVRGLRHGLPLLGALGLAILSGGQKNDAERIAMQLGSAAIVAEETVSSIKQGDRADTSDKARRKAVEATNATRKEGKQKVKKKKREIKVLRGQVQTTEQELAERYEELDQQDAVIAAQRERVHQLENQIARYEGFDQGADHQHQQTLDAVNGNNSGFGRRGPNTQPRGGRPYRQGR